MRDNNPIKKKGIISASNRNRTLTLPIRYSYFLFLLSNYNFF